ncbi:hypothetical protein ILYODFUR_028596, partial [Ilyodon furcidens]
DEPLFCTQRHTKAQKSMKIMQNCVSSSYTNSFVHTGMRQSSKAETIQPYKGRSLCTMYSAHSSLGEHVGHKKRRPTTQFISNIWVTFLFMNILIMFEQGFGQMWVTQASFRNFVPLQAYLIGNLILCNKSQRIVQNQLMVPHKTFFRPCNGNIAVTGTTVNAGLIHILFLFDKAFM